MPNKDAGKNSIQGITQAGSCPESPAAAFCAVVTDRVNVTPTARHLLVGERSAPSHPPLGPAHLLPK